MYREGENTKGNKKGVREYHIMLLYDRKSNNQ